MHYEYSSKNDLVWAIVLLLDLRANGFLRRCEFIEVIRWQIGILLRARQKVPVPNTIIVKFQFNRQ